MADQEEQASYEFGPYRLDPARRQLSGTDSEPVTLRGKAYDLLAYLVRHRGRLVEKTELLEAIWPDMVVEENNLNQAMSSLRQALGDDPKAPAYIATIKGRGYQFVGDVRDVEATPEAAPPPGARRTALAPVLVVAAVAAIAVYFYLRPDAPEPVAASPVLEQFQDATLKLVTDYDGSHSEPTLSPDGKMIAFVSDTSGTPQLWVQNLERGEPIQITDGPYAARNPSWSPDNDEIVFARTGPKALSVFSVGVLGTPEPRRIVEYGSAPDHGGQSDVFVYANGWQLFLARDDGRDQQRIMGNKRTQGFAPAQPSLSPDGQHVAYVNADEGPLGNLWVIPSAGGEPRQLTTQEVTGGPVTSPTWSSDGRHLLFTVNEGTGRSHIWRIAFEGGDAEALTSGPGGAAEPVMSTDGTRLAYTNTRSLWRLVRVDHRTGAAKTIYESRNPVVLPDVSPDGRAIVFFSMAAVGMQLYTLGVDGEDLKQLTFDDPAENTLPAWGGNGDTILYYRGRSLYELDPATGDDREVFSDFHWSSRNWLSASGARVTYHNINRPTGEQRSVVRGLGESSEIDLPAPIEAAQWSADGSELVGFFRRTGEILICDAGGRGCQSVDFDGEPVRGFRPVWTPDNQGFYYLISNESGECCELWLVDRQGTDNRHIATLLNFSGDHSAYDLDANGNIIYNLLDQSTEEIWLATAPDE